MLNDIYLGLIISILLGALIGTQREIRQQKHNKKDFAGLRTFTFISILGFILGLLSFKIFENYFLFLIGLFGIFIIVSMSYFIVLKENPHQIGITSQIASILTFLIGGFVSIGEIQLSITLAIIIATILALGTQLHHFAKKITSQEVYATLEFAIVSLVILPILPNKNYSPLELPLIGTIFENQNLISKEILSQLDVINFYHIWLMVVFISGIAYIGYILMKILGTNRGILITGFLGGLMSSTALSSSFSIESKDNKGLSKPLAIGVIIACSTMFFRIIFEVIVINPTLLGIVSLPLTLMGIGGFVFAIFIFLKSDHEKNIEKFETKSPFSLGPAFKFAALFLFITFFSKLFTLIFGNSGIYILSFISGITDVDAITISLSTLAKNSSITNFTAGMGIIIASISNTLFKGGIALYLGSKPFYKLIIYAFSIIIFIGIISIFI